MGSEIVHVLKNEEPHFEIPLGVEAVPWELWSTSSEDVTLLLSAEPVVIKQKEGLPPPLNSVLFVADAIPSIQEQFEFFLKKRNSQRMPKPL